MLFMGMANAYIMRTNMSVAIVAMVNQTAVLKPDVIIVNECPQLNQTYEAEVSPRERCRGTTPRARGRAYRAGVWLQCLTGQQPSAKCTRVMMLLFADHGGRAFRVGVPGAERHPQLLLLRLRRDADPVRHPGQEVSVSDAADAWTRGVKS